MYTGLPCCWIKRGTQHVLKCFARWSRIDNDFSWAVILLVLKVKVFVGEDPERLSICAVTAGIKREWNQKRAADMGSVICDKRLAGLLLLQASSLLLFSSGERMCPYSCRCEGKIVHCESAGFQDIPEHISVSCQGLSLRYNDLHTMLPYQFAHLNQLLWLYLDHNQIMFVDSRAFQGVRRLKELILSSNRISQLHNVTFHGVPNLRSLDLSYNKLQELQPGQFFGLRKLQNLHLRSRINFFLFPRLANLRALYLQWNRIRAVNQGLPWSWYTLQKLDISGNEIQVLDPVVFQCLPNLQVLNLESNKLANVSQEVVAAWISLTTISLAGNMWDCGPGICPLVVWLKNFRGTKDTSIICSSPKHLQGEKVMEASKTYIDCDDYEITAQSPLYLQTFDPNFDLTLEPTDPTMAPTTPPPPLPSPASEVPFPPPHPRPPQRPTFPSRANPDPRDSHQWTPSSSDSLLVTPAPEQDNVSFHKVVMGGVALFLSVSLVLSVIYVSWKRYPGATRLLQQSTVGRKRRKKSQEPEQNLSSQLQEYYMSYNPAATPEALEVLGNGTGTCTCTISGSRECENEYTCPRPLPGAWIGDIPTIH
ncbi:leucine-rich repeat transmembrane neuronal protein 4-like [Sinocyclocheilus anshuiensis]|uniref:leucine-rich repeat transmembrane neuronal protein 4-like n=1 Tax=Sinocyclocheilus anshuiensis TaxID=1608454 RepID=UPI0007BA9D7B|nr:PREDICTED: leucine-rich repeat transmembrane neuronal protein 4-like [Sinocyclocheilus anshuiensis]